MERREAIHRFVNAEQLDHYKANSTRLPLCSFSAAGGPTRVFVFENLLY